MDTNWFCRLMMTKKDECTICTVYTLWRTLPRAIFGILSLEAQMSCSTQGTNTVCAVTDLTKAPPPGCQIAIPDGTSPQGKMVQQIIGAISRRNRQATLDEQQPCAMCGACGVGECAVCQGTGTILVGETSVTSGQLRDHIIRLAKHQYPLPSYLFFVTAFPDLDLSADTNVIGAVKAEIAEHPERALLGTAPQVLFDAGHGDLVEQAAEQEPLAARHSLLAGNFFK